MVLANTELELCHLGGCDERFFNPDTGLHELRELIHSGEIRLGNRAVVVITLGRADVFKARRIAQLMEKVVATCRTFGPETGFIFAGPFPHPTDGVDMIFRCCQAREQVQRAVMDWELLRATSIADRFADPIDGRNPRLMCEDGLTVRGCQILRREINELIASFQ